MKKKRKKKVVRKRAAKKVSPERKEFLALISRVKKQLDSFDFISRTVEVALEPERLRDGNVQSFPTVEEYQKMDSLAETTMGGSLAGRVIFAVDFPKTFGLLEWVRQDLRKWPWQDRASRGVRGGNDERAERI